MPMVNKRAILVRKCKKVVDGVYMAYGKPKEYEAVRDFAREIGAKETTVTQALRRGTVLRKKYKCHYK